jgi:hypothetical protein
MHLTFWSFFLTKLHNRTKRDGKVDLSIRKDNNGLVVKYFIKFATYIEFCKVQVVNKELFEKRIDNSGVLQTQYFLVCGSSKIPGQDILFTQQRALEIVNNPGESMLEHFWCKFVYEDKDVERGNKCHTVQEILIPESYRLFGLPIENNNDDDFNWWLPNHF